MLGAQPSSVGAQSRRAVRLGRTSALTLQLIFIGLLKSTRLRYGFGAMSGWKFILRTGRSESDGSRSEIQFFRTVSSANKVF